jgi:hypothetical protein
MIPAVTRKCRDQQTSEPVGYRGVLPVPGLVVPPLPPVPVPEPEGWFPEPLVPLDLLSVDVEVEPEDLSEPPADLAPTAFEVLSGAEPFRSLTLVPVPSAVPVPGLTPVPVAGFVAGLDPPVVPWPVPMIELEPPRPFEVSPPLGEGNVRPPGPVSEMDGLLPPVPPPPRTAPVPPTPPVSRWSWLLHPLARPRPITTVTKVARAWFFRLIIVSLHQVAGPARRTVRPALLATLLYVMANEVPRKL